MTPNYIPMFLSTRTIVYIHQLFHYLEVVEVAMFYYYVSEFLHKILRGISGMIFLNETEWYSLHVYYITVHLYIVSLFRILFVS